MRLRNNKFEGLRKCGVKMDAKQAIIDSVKNNLGQYMEIVQSLYDHPEIGNEEFESMKLLVHYLNQAGFETEAGYVVPTGFLGTYDTKKPGPTIAFMCEYDALPEIGHRSEEHTSELQSRGHLVCRLLLEKKK